MGQDSRQDRRDGARKGARGGRIGAGFRVRSPIAAWRDLRGEGVTDRHGRRAAAAGPAVAAVAGVVGVPAPCGAAEAGRRVRP